VGVLGVRGGGPGNGEWGDTGELGCRAEIGDGGARPIGVSESIDFGVPFFQSMPNIDLNRDDFPRCAFESDERRTPATK